MGTARSPSLDRKVAEDIKAAIAAGAYAAGTRLPSESELAGGSPDLHRGQRQRRQLLGPSCHACTLGGFTHTARGIRESTAWPGNPLEAWTLPVSGLLAAGAVAHVSQPLDARLGTGLG
jgi:hypothetical protein